MQKPSKVSSNPRLPAEELRFLRELMSDFPCGCPWRAEEALEQINIRYLEMEKNAEQVPHILRMFSSPKFFLALTRTFHIILYNGILKNNGEFRKKGDKFQGRIGFGGDDHRRPGNFRYTGSPPDMIMADLKKTFAHLKKSSTDPVRSAMQFYQEFVKVHPFYDANGRIARLIVSIYLYHHGYYVQWASMLEGGRQTKFLKKLNECHDRMDGPDFQKYFEYLLSFFKSHIVRRDDLIES